MNLREQLAQTALNYIGNVTQTNYQFDEFIDASEGIFDCDCNEFVAFVLLTVAPNHYQMIEATNTEPDQPRPRAFIYYRFFAGLAASPLAGWDCVGGIENALPGDIIAWELPLEVDKNTGHVMFVGAAPVLDEAGNYSVLVYDSTDILHFDDSRPPGSTGVGEGYIKFRYNDAGQLGFLFAPEAVADFKYPPISIGRAVAL